ncbi:MAG: copper homeostasis protein CutC, partial [Candidatus Nephrothrix sp. EaCA]
MTLEIAAFNVSSALEAAHAGADRIELCDNPAEGGTTPSYGTLKAAKEKIDIPVFPIIRPRGGDFLYNEAEFDVMLCDVTMCKEMGFKGVVVGMLLSDGKVDAERTKKLVRAAANMQVTFHRAFDRTAHPLEAMETIIECGCARILTSGLAPYASHAKKLIKELIQKSADRIIIMPGSGVRSATIASIASETGAAELHSSAR